MGGGAWSPATIAAHPEPVKPIALDSIPLFNYSMVAFHDPPPAHFGVLPPAGASIRQA